MLKYLVMIPVLEPDCSEIEGMMQQASSITGLPRPKLGPHITLNRPLEGPSELEVGTKVRAAVATAERTRVLAGGTLFFKNEHQEYLVLPVYPNLALAKFWLEIVSSLHAVPGNEEGQYDRKNTLHVLVAEFPADLPSAHRSGLSGLSFEPRSIVVDRVTILRKRPSDVTWQEVDTYELPG